MRGKYEHECKRLANTLCIGAGLLAAAALSPAMVAAQNAVEEPAKAAQGAVMEAGPFREPSGGRV